MYEISNEMFTTKRAALDVARQLGPDTEILCYDACGLWRVIDAENKVLWDRDDNRRK
jgi:hypothetical protein